MATHVRTLLRVGVIILTLVPSGVATAQDARDPLAWPAATRESRPWTRWWWLGSAVDRPNLTRLLEQYHGAGIGGVEICPIYGAKGYEERYLSFLSPKWMDALAHTTAEAKRLGMGVDLTTGTGWPFGGPWVTADEASAKVVLKRYDVAGGATLNEALPAGTLQCLIAKSDAGDSVDLTSRVQGGRLDWTAPAGNWHLYALAQSGPVQKVKRAAPGGEGNVVDPYSVPALNAYLAAFDKAFGGYQGERPRAHFHDSFEYYGANWTDNFFDQFRRRRGYDLRAQLPALFGEGDADAAARVRCDYRETISDLHLDYLHRWNEWAHAQGSLTRNQAHGAPANLIDMYAAADIPETEIFHLYEEGHVPMLKLSSSAAHLTGRPLASSESFTWLGEHFQVPLSQAKPAADFLFLSGVNHVFFHGIPYSPQDAPWPGWLFYASVNFGPNGGLWHDLPAFNAYLTRCQSILQSGKPANDVLLYVPFHDIWQAPPAPNERRGGRGGPEAGLLTTFTTPGKWMTPFRFYAAAMRLWEKGYGYDEVSDRLLAGATVNADGLVVVGGSSYRAVVVPRMRVIPPPTLRKLVELAEAGASVVVQELPSDVPGFGNLEQRRAELKELDARIQALTGGVRVGDDIDQALLRLGVPREPMADEGLRFVRRSHAGGYHYFIVNRGEKPIDGWVALATPAQSAVLMDPRLADRTGVAAVRSGEGGAAVYLQLAPKDSIILRTFTNEAVTGRPWSYARPAGEARGVVGTWRVKFIEGGPKLPESYETGAPSSWTNRDDPEARRFAGTARYAIEFDMPQATKGLHWLLDLGRVAESARVRLNGKEVATLWCEPFQVDVSASLVAGRNTLEVDVTNVAANRIADLDRRGVNWKAFHEINFVDLDYKPFDASRWPLRDSGLLGPVRLVPIHLQTADELGGKAAEAPRTSWKFDFGPGKVAAGYAQVLPDTVYTDERGYGFDLGSKVEGTDRGGDDPLTRDFCGADHPFFFSVKVPEGNYRVTVTLGNPQAEAYTVIKAESRRLMAEKVATEHGRTATATFTVNVRTPQIAGGGRVKLKERERDYLHWDDKLTLEFNGYRPCVCGVEIERAEDAVTAYLVGDSTVTDQPREPWNSWGQMLPRFFKASVAVANHAESGESLRSSAGARRFDKVFSTIRAGDYLFIQYGHNDQKEKGPGVGALTTYKADLERLVLRTKERGATPVLVTPVNRRTFDAAGKITNSLGDYPEAVRRVAAEHHVPLIDLNAMSKPFYEALGPEGSRKAFVDNTHHNNYGSYELARCVVEGIRQNKLPLAAFLTDDAGPFDPSKPDPIDRFAIPPSPQRDPTKPDGN